MDHDGWGWAEGDDTGDGFLAGDDLSGDADTADLGGHGAGHGYDGLAEHGDAGGHGEPGEHGDAGPAGPPGGFLEDDPMGAFGDQDAADGFGHDGPNLPDDGYEAVSVDHEAVVGADPDIDPGADWSPADFPEQLDFAAPEPVDGYPWSDPSAVAAPGTGDDPAAGPDAAPPAQELLDYAGADGAADPWSALVGSDDPATSSLGRWWAPGG